jgi:hypothetical protein
MNPQRFVEFFIRRCMEQVGSSISFVFYGPIDLNTGFYFYSLS